MLILGVTPYMMFNDYFVYVQEGAQHSQQARVDQFHFLMVDQLQSSGQLTTLNAVSDQQKEAICSRLKTRFGILKAKQISRLTKTCNSAPKMDSRGLGTLASLASLVVGLAVFFFLK